MDRRTDRRTDRRMHPIWGERDALAVGMRLALEGQARDLYAKYPDLYRRAIALRDKNRRKPAA